MFPFFVFCQVETESEMVDEADHGATSVDFNNPLWSSSPMVNTTNFRSLASSDITFINLFFFPQREQHKFNNKSNLKYVAFRRLPGRSLKCVKL